MFDGKWETNLVNLGLKIWLMMRYVDDMRVALPPVKPGWRWYQGGLRYTKRWELEDSQVTPEKRTKDLLAKTMQGVEDYLAFTMESGEDFEGGAFPPWTLP